MSNYRLASNHEFFVRDLLRDYCTVYLAVAEQQQRFRRDGNVSYTALRSLMGEAMSKGVFWRLKDTAHFLFRNDDPRRRGSHSTSGDSESDARYDSIGRLIDWCIGYAFHECSKLREDAFQAQHYAQRLLQLSRGDELGMRLSAPLLPLIEQTSESVQRELNRIVHVLRAGMLLLNRFLSSAGENCSLARWLATDQGRVRAAFQNLYPGLLRALYGSCQERMYTLAVVDLLDCGRSSEAKALLQHAAEIGSLDEEGRQMLRALEEVPVPAEDVFQPLATVEEQSREYEENYGSAPTGEV